MMHTLWSEGGNCVLDMFYIATREWLLVDSHAEDRKTQANGHPPCPSDNRSCHYSVRNNTSIAGKLITVSDGTGGLVFVWVSPAELHSIVAV